MRHQRYRCSWCAKSLEFSIWEYEISCKLDVGDLIDNANTLDCQIIIFYDRPIEIVWSSFSTKMVSSKNLIPPNEKLLALLVDFLDLTKARVLVFRLNTPVKHCNRSESSVCVSSWRHHRLLLCSRGCEISPNCLFFERTAINRVVQRRNHKFAQVHAQRVQLNTCQFVGQTDASEAWVPRECSDADDQLIVALENNASTYRLVWPAKTPWSTLTPE